MTAVLTILSQLQANDTAFANELASRLEDQSADILFTLEKNCHLSFKSCQIRTENVELILEILDIGLLTLVKGTDEIFAKHLDINAEDTNTAILARDLTRKFAVNYVLYFKAKEVTKLLVITDEQAGKLLAKVYNELAVSALNKLSRQ